MLEILSRNDQLSLYLRNDSLKHMAVFLIFSSFGRLLKT